MFIPAKKARNNPDKNNHRSRRVGQKDIKYGTGDKAGAFNLMG